TACDRSCGAVAFDCGRVELDAETGPLRQPDRAVALLAERLLQELVAQPIWVLVEFEHQPVRDRGDKMQCRGEQYRAGEGVWRHHQVVRLRQRGDAAAFGEAAGPGDVGLDDIHRPARDQLAEAVEANLRLVAGDRRGQDYRDAGAALDVVGRDRLLYPIEIEGHERVAHPDRHRQAPRAVDID